MNHEKALGVAWAAFNHKDGNDHTAFARAIDAYLSALVPDEVAGVVDDLNSLGDEHGAVSSTYETAGEVMRLAASTLTALAARAEKAERETDEKIARALAKADYEAERAGDFENELDEARARITALEAENAALRARLEEAGKVTRECSDLLTDLDLGRSIHNGRFPENKIDGPLWAQIGRVTSAARRFLEEAK